MGPGPLSIRTLYLIYFIDHKLILVAFLKSSFIYSQTFNKQTPSGPEKRPLKRGVRLWEVKNVVFV